MAKVRVKMQTRGSRAVLQSRPVERDIADRAARMASQAGEGFEARTIVGRTRALGSVTATTAEAMLAESENFALTRSLDAGR